MSNSKFVTLATMEKKDDEQWATHVLTYNFRPRPLPPGAPQPHDARPELIMFICDPKKKVSAAASAPSTTTTTTTIASATPAAPTAPAPAAPVVADNECVCVVGPYGRIDYPAELARVLDRSKPPSDERIAEVKYMYPNSHLMSKAFERNAAECRRASLEMRKSWPDYDIWQGGVVQDPKLGPMDPRNMMIGMKYLALEEENRVIGYIQKCASAAGSSGSNGASESNKKEEAKPRKVEIVENVDPAQAWLQLKAMLKSYIGCLDDFEAKHPYTRMSDSDQYKAVKHELDNFEDRGSDEQLSRINRALNSQLRIDLSHRGGVMPDEFVAFSNDRKHRENAVVDALTEVIVSTVTCGKSVMMRFRY